jgi:hypothetical protein
VVAFVLLVIASARAFAQPVPQPEPPAPTSPTPAPPPDPAPPAPPPTGPSSTADESPAASIEVVRPPQHKELTALELQLDAQRLCAEHSPDCDWLATFSSLERQSVARALAARGYMIDAEPWGKTIAHVRVYNEDVFAEDNWLQFINIFHYTTREKSIRDELTIGAGESWDDDKVAESARVLRDPLYSTVVALLPVRTAAPDKVDLLVVTRDVWSLRLNTKYTFQEGSLTNLSFSLSENNLLGHRNVLAATVVMDQGSIAVGPLFIDKNFLGKHLYLRGSSDDIMTRQSLDIVTPTGARTPSGDPNGLLDGGGYHREGGDASLQLALPLWALASEWGWGTSFAYSDAIARSYLGTGLRGYDDPRTPGMENIAREYRYKTESFNAYGTRQWGSLLKQQFTFGYTLQTNVPTLIPFTILDPTLQEDFMRDVFPHNEVISQPYIQYAFYQPRYRTLRNYATYELAEDVQIGPSLTVSYGQSLAPLGSTHTFGRPGLAVGWTFAAGADGFVTSSASTSLRIQPNADGIHDTIDNSASVAVRAATPTMGWWRVVMQSELDTNWHNTQNTYYTIGSDSGLRGYPINAFYGQRRFSAQVEARTTALLPVWVLRLGGVAFYEAGGAANSLAEMPIYQDVGFGVRALFLPTSRDLFRFDVAMPLRPSPSNPVRPHFMAGFASYF